MEFTLDLSSVQQFHDEFKTELRMVIWVDYEYVICECWKNQLDWGLVFMVQNFHLFENSLNPFSSFNRCECRTGHKSSKQRRIATYLQKFLSLPAGKVLVVTRQNAFISNVFVFCFWRFLTHWADRNFIWVMLPNRKNLAC